MTNEEIAKDITSPLQTIQNWTKGEIAAKIIKALDAKDAEIRELRRHNGNYFSKQKELYEENAALKSKLQTLEQGELTAQSARVVDLESALKCLLFDVKDALIKTAKGNPEASKIKTRSMLIAEKALAALPASAPQGLNAAAKVVEAARKIAYWHTIALWHNEIDDRACLQIKDLHDAVKAYDEAAAKPTAAPLTEESEEELELVAKNAVEKIAGALNRRDWKAADQYMLEALRGRIKGKG